ncbi:hypothetical protein J0S82_001328, partial [Galemys pyrenaicus]
NPKTQAPTQLTAPQILFNLKNITYTGHVAQAYVFHAGHDGLRCGDSSHGPQALPSAFQHCSAHWFGQTIAGIYAHSPAAPVWEPGYWATSLVNCPVLLRWLVETPISTNLLGTTATDQSRGGHSVAGTIETTVPRETGGGFRRNFRVHREGRSGFRLVEPGLPIRKALPLEEEDWRKTNIREVTSQPA